MSKKCLTILLGLLMLIGCQESTVPVAEESPAAGAELEPAAIEVGHPDTTGAEWTELFSADLSNALAPEGVWSFTDGVLTATEDQAIWTKSQFDDFILDLEFKNAECTNSGVFVYCSSIEEWVNNSVEIQIADNFCDQWANSPKSWQCGAVFGHLPASPDTVKKPGEWNRFTITCVDQLITVVLNGQKVNEMDMGLWTSATTNPDGSEIPEWLSTPFAELPTFGHIGLQGKHAGAPVWFRNLKIRELE